MRKALMMKCTRCNRSRKVAREKTDPKAAVRTEVACDDCNPGDFADPVFFDRDGQAINPATGQAYGGCR